MKDVGLAADLAVLDVALPAAGKLVHVCDVPLAAARALETGFHSNFSDLLSIPLHRPAIDSRAAVSSHLARAILDFYLPGAFAAKVCFSLGRYGP